MKGHIFTGFGFGPIQSGLFVNEAFQSGNFSRITVAEIDQELIDAVRANNGSYYVNVARKDGIEVIKIDNVELLNITVESDRNVLLDSLALSTEIATCLPSVSFYEAGDNSVASVIAEGLQNSKAEATIIYTAENNNRAAEILEKAVIGKIAQPLSERTQFLNTVIGKMSQVITDPWEVREHLRPIAPGTGRAFLVEEFNKILVTGCAVKDFKPGIEVFVERDDLLPFEEAKLYGHNAIHALLAYIGALKGYSKMAELKNDAEIMRIAEDAFLDESGAALIKKYCGVGDELFTEAGYKVYAEDLLERMTNTYLADTTERAGRDPVRKLGYNDRIFGTMTLAMEQGIEPTNMALGAMAGIAVLLEKAEENDLVSDLRFGDWQKLSEVEIEKIIKWIWSTEYGQYDHRLIEYAQEAKRRLVNLFNKEDSATERCG